MTFRGSACNSQPCWLIERKVARAHTQRMAELSRFRRERAAPTRTCFSPEENQFHMSSSSFWQDDPRRNRYNFVRARKRDIFRRSRRHGRATTCFSLLRIPLREHVITFTRAAASLALSIWSPCNRGPRCCIDNLIAIGEGAWPTHASCRGKGICSTSLFFPLFLAHTHTHTYTRTLTLILVTFFVQSLVSVICEFMGRTSVPVTRKAETRISQARVDPARRIGNRKAARIKCQAARKHGHDTSRGHSRTAGPRMRRRAESRGWLAISTRMREQPASRHVAPTSLRARRKRRRNRQNTHPHTSCRGRRTVYVVQRPPYCAPRDVTSVVAHHELCRRSPARARPIRIVDISCFLFWKTQFDADKSL